MMVMKPQQPEVSTQQVLAGLIGRVTSVCHPVGEQRDVLLVLRLNFDDPDVLGFRALFSSNDSNLDLLAFLQFGETGAPQCR